jgi:hypothetical protein
MLFVKDCGLSISRDWLAFGFTIKATPSYILSAVSEKVIYLKRPKNETILQSAPTSLLLLTKKKVLNQIRK